MKSREFFPLFVRTSGRKVVVFGGGNVAARRVKTLLGFRFHITVVAPHIQKELQELSGQFTWICGQYDPKYLEHADLVLACTSDREVNQQIGIDAKSINLLVNVCDNKEACSFYFPGVVFCRDATIGIAGNGDDHKAVKTVIDEVRNRFEGD